MNDTAFTPPTNVRAVLFAHYGVLAGPMPSLGDAATGVIAEETQYGIVDVQPPVQGEIERLLPLVGYAIDQQADHVLDADYKLTPAATIVCETLESISGEMPDADLVQHVVDTFGRLEATPVDARGAEIVQTLRSRGLATGVISNGMMPGQFLRERWAQAGLSDAWDVATLASEWGWCMPHPSIFTEALKGLKQRPEQVLFVGSDFRTEIQGAEAAGMRTVWVRSDVTCPVQQVERSYVISDLRLLLDWLGEVK